MANLTHERLLQKVHYDPITGVFTRIRARPCPPGVTPRVTGKTSTGRLQISVDGVRYEAGRLARFYVTKSWPKYIVDHEDTDPFNNRWLNLRDGRSTHGHQAPQPEGIQMNVSKGDLALVVGGAFKGATCTVEYGDGWYRDTDTQQRFYMWVVRFPRPMRWLFGPTSEPRHCGMLPDEELRRLTGPGSVGEVLTEEHVGTFDPQPYLDLIGTAPQ